MRIFCIIKKKKQKKTIQVKRNKYKKKSRECARFRSLNLNICERLNVKSNRTSAVARLR